MFYEKLLQTKSRSDSATTSTHTNPPPCCELRAVVLLRSSGEEFVSGLGTASSFSASASLTPELLQSGGCEELEVLRALRGRHITELLTLRQEKLEKKRSSS
ncbi:hypothetical protein AOLI_G00244320 [Acnodon oligacanthus]